jgi:hypothetical protein
LPKPAMSRIGTLVGKIGGGTSPIAGEAKNKHRLKARKRENHRFISFPSFTSCFLKQHRAPDGIVNGMQFQRGLARIQEGAGISG